MNLSTLLFASSVVALTSVGDWPQYNGAAGDRASSEDLVCKDWSDGAPSVVWRIPTEAGFSSFAVAGERAFTLVGVEGAETLAAFRVEDGVELWASNLSTATYDGGGGAGADGNQGGDGPRSTPSVDGDRVYVFDASLVLHCVDAATGRQVWRRDVRADHKGQELRWQNAASPLVEGDRVLVVGGGSGQSLLAFDKHTGKLAWSTGDELMTHATPIAATIHGRRQVIFYVQSGLVACDPEDGEELWRAEYPYKVSSAASPVVYEDMVYVSAGYGVGAGVFRIQAQDAGFRVETLWQKRNKLINHWSTPVCHDGYLYGMFSFKKYGEGPLCCVSLETGEIQWTTPGFGPGNVIAVGETLVALSDAGDVVLAKLDPKEYAELARAHLVDGKCWSSPSFADGQLYVRSTQEGVRVDLSQAP